MRSDEIAFLGTMLAIFGGCVALAGVHSGRRHRQSKQRLDILQTALERPDLDVATRREIMRVLTDEHAARGVFASLLRPALWLRLWFAAGWLMFFIAGGFWLLDFLGVIREVDAAYVVPTTLLGLAMMTLPLGLRELMQRDRGVADAG